MISFKKYFYFNKAPAFKDAIAVGTLSPEVFHASGLAASRKHDGVLYTHNDGDDPHRRSPIVFAINASSGALIARLMVYPATNEDWEDRAGIEAVSTYQTKQLTSSTA